MLLTEHTALSFFILIAISPSIKFNFDMFITCKYNKISKNNAEILESNTEGSCGCSKVSGLASGAESHDEISSRAANTGKFVANFAREANVGYVSLCVEGRNKTFSGEYGTEYVIYIYPSE